MSLVSRLEWWRTEFARNHARDPREPVPDEEKVLGQFLYMAIMDLVDSEEDLGAVVDARGTLDADEIVDRWIDIWAALPDDQHAGSA